MAVMGYTLALIIALMQLVNKTSRFRLGAAFMLEIERMVKMNKCRNLSRGGALFISL